MAQKFQTFDRSAGADKEVEFITASTGSSDGGKGIATKEDGTIDPSFMPPGIGADTITAVAGEALNSSTPIVNLFNDGGTIKARKADATSGGVKPASGFIKSNYSLGQSVTVYIEGYITGLSDLDITKRCFTSKTAGAVTQDVSEYTTNDIAQDIGYPTATDTMHFKASRPLILA